MTAQDGVEDMTILSNIDEHGINTNLRVRYSNDRIYTYTGTILVAVNPYKELPIYETEWVFLYNGQGQKMSSQEPHVFAIAEAAYNSLQTDNTNQACVISGESGAGKTESTKFILQYLCTVTSNHSTWMEHQILEANTILEAFGNAKTVRNDNSSRFGKFIQVCFDSRYQIKGCVIQDYLLEKSRITFQSKGERNYHVFYQLVAGASNSLEIRNQFLMESAESYYYLSQSGCYQIEGVDDSSAFESLRLAMSVLNMPPEMCDGIFSVLSAILWLGNLSFEDFQDGERCKLKAEDEEILATVATLLGLDAIRLTQTTLQRQINVRGNITDIPFKVHEARENRHAMAKALYSKTFSWINNYINTCTAPGSDSKFRFLGVLDIFGFENFEVNSFEQLCINYANEKLHRFFNHYVFALEQEMYKQEEINFSHIYFMDNTPCVELLEKPPKCIFRLLTEECRIPKGTDTSYVNKLHSEFETHSNYLRGDDRRQWALEFGIKHYAGDVIYKVSGFLDKNKDAQQIQLFDLMAESKNVFVKDLVKFRDLLEVSRITCNGNNTISTRSSLSSNTPFTLKGRPTVADAFRHQLTALVDVLHSTNPWYVRCIKPNMQKAANCYDNTQVLTQLHYLGMLDIIRIRREGYPIHYTLEDFISRYKCTNMKINYTNDKVDACIKILESFKMLPKDWQVGKSRVFLRASVYEPLEEKRNTIIDKMAVIIQANMKGYFVWKDYVTKRKAAIIIQQHFRGHRQKLAFLRKKRATITIQSFVRGMFAREVAEAMRQMKKVEEDMRMKELEEQEKKMLEEKTKSEIKTDQEEGWNNNNFKTESKKLEIDDIVLKLLEQRYGLAQTEVQNITKMMEQNQILYRNNQISTSLVSSNNSANSGLNSSCNYVDLDKMFSYWNELQAEANKSQEISKQFDALIERTGAQLNDLNNLRIRASPVSSHESEQSSQVSEIESSPSAIPKKKSDGTQLVTNGNSISHQSQKVPLTSTIYSGSVDFKQNGNCKLNVTKDYLINNVNRHDKGQVDALVEIESSNVEQKRKQRVDKKLQELQEEQVKESFKDPNQNMISEGDSNNLRMHDMLEFASTYFNTHSRDCSSGSLMKRTLMTRRKKSGDEGEILSTQEMLSYSSTNVIPTSHIQMHDPENALIACSTFKDICKYLSQDLKSESELKIIQSIVKRGIEREELRDEIFIQLIRQSTNNGSREETLKAWVLLGLTSSAFQPSKLFSKYFQSHLQKHLRKDPTISCYAQFCIDNLHPKGSAQSSRKMPPSSLEINAVKTLSSLVCRFYFLDGRTKAVDIHPCDTASVAIMYLSNKIGLRNLDGWALYEKTPEYEKVIRGYDYLADFISSWELQQKNAIYGSKYGTLTKHSGSGLTGSEFRFIFKKRLFRSNREIPHDPVEISLLYAQAANSVVKLDEFPVSERIALQLAGLQAQVLLGEFVKGRGLENYENIDTYICHRIRKLNSNRSQTEWASKIAESHRMYGSGKSDIIAKVWYLSVVMQYPLYGTTLFSVSYKGYLSYGHNLLLGINADGVLIVSAKEKSILSAYRYCDIESLSVYQGQENFIIFKLVKTFSETHKFFTFETKQKDEIAALVTSYCPSLNNWLRKSNGIAANKQMLEHKNAANQQVAPTRRLLKMSIEDRIKFHQEVINCRKILVESGVLRKSLEENLGFVRNTLRRFNRSRGDKIKLEYAGELDSEVFRHFPHSFWAFTKLPLQSSIMVISDVELESASITNFNAILAYSGLTFVNELIEANGNENEMDESEWPRAIGRDQIRLAQNIIHRCIRKDASDIFKNEFFLQLIKQTTDHPDPNSKVNIRHWQLLTLACSITYPTDRRILAYLHGHLRKCSLDEVTEEGQFAQFALRNLQGTLETRGRKMAPSRSEIISTINCRRIYARIHFLDGQFQAVEFDACATTAEVIEQIQLKIGLRANCPGYALYQNLGNTIEQALQPEEKVGDALAFWERWHEEQGKMISRNKVQHYFIFKKHLFLDSYLDLNDPVEKELLFHQIIANIRQDRFPITDQEAIMLFALKAQYELGDYEKDGTDCRQAISQCLPPRLLATISPEAVITHHQTMKGMKPETAKQAFFNLIQSWPLHKATLFEVTQTYTSSWSRNLWLAIDQTGMHLLELKTKNVLTSCDYRNMVDYSPAVNSLMIVATGKKFIFLTQQALQIAHLIRDYTTALAKERGLSRRKSVEFDLLPKIPKSQPPIPPPRPSLQQRQQLIEQSLYQNQLHQPIHLTNQGSNHFQPTHRRSRPLSILYKPPPIMMTEAEQI